MKIVNLIILVFVIALQACSREVELPAAAPLSANDEELSRLYKLGKGPFSVVVNQLVVANDAGSALELTISYPDAVGPFPLLIFSHGNWSSKDKYQPVVNHWVSHGYVVVAPNHADCCSMVQGIFNSLRYGQVGLIQRRVQGINFLLDNISLLERQLDGLKGLIDKERIAITGHSFGAYTAQQLIGAGMFNPDTKSFEYYRDARVKAVVAISPPGPMFDTITPESWSQLNKPMLVATGTWDSNAQFWPDWRLHKMSFDTAQAGSNYALITQGADHYFGNLICRPEREQAPQYDALSMLNTVSVAFLDAYLKEDQAAHRFLAGDTLQQITDGFSVLERR